MQDPPEAALVECQNLTITIIRPANFAQHEYLYQLPIELQLYPLLAALNHGLLVSQSMHRKKVTGNL